MVVVEMPQSKPVITGGHQELPGAPKMKYKPGDVLNLTCTSAPSNPPAQLEWRLNDKKVCISNAILLRPQSKKLYRWSPPYAHFVTWKKPCYMKFVLVGL